MGAGSTPSRAGGDDGCADAVLLLGPLYHFTSGEDRVAALREARRVVAANGVVCGAVISRFASTWDGLCWRFLDEPGFEEIVERDVAEGIHLNPTRRPVWFTTAYFHWPEEAAAELAAAGWAVADLLEPLQLADGVALHLVHAATDRRDRGQNHHDHKGDS